MRMQCNDMRVGQCRILNENYARGRGDGFDIFLLLWGTILQNFLYYTKTKVNGVKWKCANFLIASSICKNSCLDKIMQHFPPGFALCDDITDTQGQGEYNIRS